MSFCPPEVASNCVHLKIQARRRKRKNAKSNLVCFVFCFQFQLMPVGTTQFGQADLSKTETDTEAPMTQLGRAAASSSIIGTTQFGQADLSKTETDTEAPMTQR